MNRVRRRDLCLWLVLFAQVLPASAQVFNVEKDRLQLVEMDHLWHFHSGDDPVWAEPSFDDSRWPLVAPTTPWTVSQPAPSTISGWYRLHILLPDSPEPFSLLLPALPTRYQVFANGREVGHSGSPSDLVRSPVPRLFKIPADISRSRVLVLCIRVEYQSHFAWFAGPPGFHGTPVLGSESQTAARFHLDRVDALNKAVSAFVVAFLCLQVTAVSALFYLLRRSDREYKWLAIYSLANAINFALVASLPLLAWPLVPVGLFLGLLSVVFEISEFLIVANLLTPPRHSLAEPIAEADGSSNRIPRYPWVLVVVTALLIAAVNGMLLMDGANSGFWNNIQSGLFLGVLISIWWLIRTSASKDRLRAWIVFAGLVLVFSYFIVLNLVVGLRFVSRPVKDFMNGTFRSLILSPFPVGCWELIGIVIVVSLFAVILERFIQARRDEERLHSEIEAARLVQQVLVPAETPLIPGFHIESLYKPAGQVGGDFFQIVSTLDGGALIVIGDVSGKGMPAAMTVSLLVGTFRTLAHYTQSPGEILTAMNRRMLARSHGGFTTCLVLRADARGELVAASAGHLAPYCNGEELNIDGGLPLGLDASASYAESIFELPPDAQLTLVTDGVVEARAKDGQLFGFERSRAISNQSAQKIAEAARSFGQEDDITVLTLSRVRSAV